MCWTPLLGSLRLQMDFVTISINDDIELKYLPVSVSEIEIMHTISV